MENFRNLQEADGQKDGVSQCLLGGVYDDTNFKRHHVDLRHMEDDKTVLKNPHKGWFWHYIDNGMERPAYRAEHDIQNDGLEDFPGLNHLYLRFDWGDVEKVEGAPDFSYLDETMALWGERGYKFHLRVCTYEGTDKIMYPTPKFVYEAGARCYRLPGGAIQPDYGDPVYLEKLENFIRLLGEKYNGDPRIELMDVGTYGTWGEGHTEFGDRKIYPLETIYRHLNITAKYFPDTFLLINDDLIASRFANGPDECRELLDYAEARGFGLQDDSICVSIYTGGNYATMRAAWAFDRLYLNAPSVIEFDHYKDFIDAPHLFRGGLTTIEACKNAHATFAGFHGYPRPWLAREPYLTEYLANRLGYWFFLTSAEVPPLLLNAANIIKIEVINKGYAPAYHRYQLKVMLKDGQGRTFVCDTDADARRWMPGEKVKLTLRIAPKGIVAGRCGVYIGLFEGETPVKFAVKDEYCDNGFVKICETDVYK